MAQAEYEVVIEPGGTVTSTLLNEATNQSNACRNVQQLMASLGGRTVSHDPHCDSPQPVNINLNLPGSGK